MLFTKNNLIISDYTILENDSDNSFNLIKNDLLNKNYPYLRIFNKNETEYPPVDDVEYNTKTELYYLGLYYY